MASGFARQTWGYVCVLMSHLWLKHMIDSQHWGNERDLKMFPKLGKDKCLPSVS